jgi:branched-chain amino acid transport system permease protein
VVGGGDSILGSFLGAAFVTLLPYGVEALFKMWTVPIRIEQSLFAVQYGIYGLAILLFLLFEPKGLVGLWSRVRSFFENWPFKY